uniref:Carboxylic ester hydrolase n=2 Tax=Lygus hesperus TaxID=30085 RepID=A0A0A9XAS2_LYGHE
MWGSSGRDVRSVCLAGIVVVLRLVEGSWSQEEPEVEVEQGLLRGKYMKSEELKRSFAAFLGVPYAEPPVGPSRFKEANPAGPWLGVLNATNFGPSCLQYSHFTQNTKFEVYGSEDCLYLNVYTPNLPRGKSESGLLDVIFYIHGGAFMFLAGHPFGPEYLLDRQIVLVTFNYRLGPLGFLSTEDSIVPGNNGLKDQLLALKWVKRNIKKFGGNPNRISLAGTSAGGASVHYHVLSPRTKGLFTHGIIMSGAVLNPWPVTENALEKARRLSGELGCPTENTAEMVDCLRTRPADHIVGKSKLFIPWVYNPFTPFGPVVETPNPSAFIQKEPLDIILSKEASDVPLLFSYTADEGLYPGGEIIKNEKLLEELDSRWTELLPHLLDYNFTIPQTRQKEVADKIKSFYLGNNEAKRVRGKIIQMVGDRLFAVGIRESAKLHAELYQSPSYAYVFDFKGPERGFMDTHIHDGVSHGDDLAYLFKKDFPWGPIGSDKESKRVSHFMIDMWMNFITDSMDTTTWPDLKQSLPGFGYLEVKSGSASNLFKVETSDIEDFWRGLGFQENVKERLHSEL